MTRIAPRTVRVFVASSSENLAVVDAICARLRETGAQRIEPAPWHQGTFKLSQTHIESLEAELGRAAFAILVLTADDLASIRARRYRVPRDNVLFELGLFMGRLGRRRCYLVHSDRDPKLPSDLLGVSAAVYRHGKPAQLARSVAPVCDAIVERIAELELERQRAFCARFAGAWWERIRTRKGNEIAFFHALADDELRSVRFVDGQHFSARGVKVGDWSSTVVGFTESEHALVYGWAGRHPPTRRGDAVRVEGYGTFKLVASAGRYQRGTGGFIDVDPNRVATAQWKTVELARVKRKSDLRVMSEGSETSRGALAKRVLERW